MYAQEIKQRLAQPETVLNLHRVMLAVEGVDGAGKTTFVSALRSVLQHQCYVFDRWWLTCKVMDYHMSRPKAGRRDVDAEIEGLKAAGFKPLVVVLEPTLEDVCQRLNARGDYSHTLEELVQLRDLFRSLIVPCPKMIMTRTSSGTIRDIAEQVAIWTIAQACR